MKISQMAMVVLISAVVALAIGYMMPRGGNGGASVKESAYERVMRTGTLRCGYIIYPRLSERDLNTGKMSGIAPDLMEEIGKQLSLKIEWTEEMTFASAFDGLNAGRYDAACFPFTQTPGRARVNEFTLPVLYAPYYLYARAKDYRFDNHYERVNDKAVKVAILEGEMSQTVKAEMFANAATVSLPAMAEVSQVLMQVDTGKADVAMTEPSSAEPFLVNNPGKLRRVAGPSLRMQAGGLSVGVGEEKLKSLLNTTIRSMLDNGILQRILDKNTTMPDQFFYPARQWGESSRPVAP